MREFVGEEIAKLDDKNIVVLVGDLGFKTFEKFKAKYPNRYFNVGIMEQSMVGIATGLALEGLKPFVYSMTPFLIERAFEQIKMIDEMNLNVKLIGYTDETQRENYGITHFEILTPEVLEGIFKNLKYIHPSFNEIPEILRKENPAFLNIVKHKEQTKEEYERHLKSPYYS